MCVAKQEMEDFAFVRSYQKLEGINSQGLDSRGYDS